MGWLDSFGSKLTLGQRRKWSVWFDFFIKRRKSVVIFNLCERLFVVIGMEPKLMGKRMLHVKIMGPRMLQQFTRTNKIIHVVYNLHFLFSFLGENK